MANNILSYFTKDITNLQEKNKYIDRNLKYGIIIFYNEVQIFLCYSNKKLIINELLHICKNAIYNENKCLRYFANSYKRYNKSLLLLKINKNYHITYKFKKFINFINFIIINNSYFIKYKLKYKILYRTILHYKLYYFNRYIYKYKNTTIFGIKILRNKYYTVKIFIPNKYELIFYSNLFSIFFGLIIDLLFRIFINNGKKYFIIFYQRYY
jgi:hypothetical protein